MKKVIMVLAAVGLISSGVFAADLAVEAQFDINGKDFSKAYLTVKGAAASVEKDTIDATTGASKAKATEVWNTYRNGPDKKGTIPGGIQSLVKYGVSTKDFVVDAFNAKKNADGTITIQYIHRGKAYKMVTDKTGKLVLPKGDYKVRTVAVLTNGENLVSKDFSPSGKVADVNWAKVWDNSIAPSLIAKVKAADGTETEVKTSAVADDFPASANYYEGVLQVTITGNLMLVKGELNAKK